MAIEHPLDLLRDYAAIATGARRDATQAPTPFITLLDVAVARGARQVDGWIGAAEFERVGIPLVAGCEGCGSTIPADGAYPSRTGHLECRDCIAQTEAGFAQVTDYEEWAREVH